ncbi:hypothetical protein [Streptosporangium amethystogenes]|uniref:hypothetical protein n=1 Tax=Streptosporangium amethystogenes TaxID=2002 RepID=UPI00068A81A1|nr:hypothetical protein [Streptosporangium amethystogenes]
MADLTREHAFQPEQSRRGQRLGDGRPRILTFADPEVASQAPGSRCNVGASGAVLPRMAAEDPSCEGILVNSATKLISIIISRASAPAIAQGPV